MTEINLPQAFKPNFFDDIEFNFQIMSLTKKDILNHSDIVISVSWKLFGKYNNIVEEHSSEMCFSEIELQNQESFIDYNNLTEDVVKSWFMYDDLLENIKCSIANKINSRLSTQEMITNFPWSQDNKYSS
jgi:hypothetical protein